ncbi:hypothetical protein MSAN_02015700 [Mycena sanguinolenta]|uniref:Uncharacterized protein n=1 Tax=Mycena sanguinolenta TaxID=230812 RepID=A0A8H6XLQ3_9AGAR|nr:hypothetical protein MSAN_02015700 [Mycena sanguinolenta]
MASKRNPLGSDVALFRNRPCRALQDVASLPKYRDATAIPYRRSSDRTTAQGFPANDGIQKDHTSRRSDFSTMDLSKRTIESLTSVLFRLRNLESLDLLLNITVDFTDTLDHAHFKNLSAFRYTVQFDNHPSLSSFLNRHPTITHLTLHPSFDEPRQLALDPIHLPHLAFYDGPSDFVRFLDKISTSAVSLVYLTFFPDHDGDVDRTLKQLAPMTALHTLAAFTTGNDIPESALLESAARHIPWIKFAMLQNVRDNPAPISQAAARSIATSLRKLPSLRVLCLRVEGVEHKTVALWGQASKSLFKVTLHATSWMRKRGQWASEPQPA